MQAPLKNYKGKLIKSKKSTRELHDPPPPPPKKKKKKNRIYNQWVLQFPIPSYNKNKIGTLYTNRR